MHTNLKKIIVAALLLAAITIPVFAQRTGAASGGSSSAPSKPVLTVQCNVRNAQVEIGTVYYKNGPLASGTAPFSAQLDAGTYVVTVSAPGYKQEQQNVNLSSSMTLNFNLASDQPVQQSLTVQSNVRDAKVVITGGLISGQLIGSAPFTAQLARGNYSISVSAPGYISQQQQLNLNSNRTLNINLDAESYNLTITSNVSGAKVFIRGGNINGQLSGVTDMTSVLPLGTYTIKVNAPGYYAEEKTLVFNQATTLNFDLRSRNARLDIIIPNEILDYSQGNPAAQIKIYDNGRKVNGGSLELAPGQHTIRVTSGGLAAQQTVNVKAGESYRIELDFGFALIKQ